MDDNPYRAPAAEYNQNLEADRGISIDESARERDLRVFVGKKADYYMVRWYPRLHGLGKGAGFNLWAFLFTAFWMSYRKMYRPALIVYGILFTMSVLQNGAAAVGLGVSGVMVANIITLIVSLIVAIYSGIKGNAWYLDHAQRVIEETRSSGLTGERYLDTLAMRGRTNFWGALGINLVYALLVGVVSVVIAIASGQVPQ